MDTVRYAWIQGSIASLRDVLSYVSVTNKSTPDRPSPRRVDHISYEVIVFLHGSRRAYRSYCEYIAICRPIVWLTSHEPSL